MEFRGTTICAVKRDGQVAIAGDGQVTMGESVILKGTAVKVKRIYDGKALMGYAGSVSDAFALSEKFEEMLQKYSGNLMRSAVELAQLWRNDKMPRKLEALLIVADRDNMLIVSGSGEVIDPDGEVCAIGSGGNYALAAARALAKNTTLSAEDIARKSLEIAGELCVFTNDHITVEVL
ncbi:MAG: ATP-dependent protease subunit HslV [Clostridia bacterium]|nr:ATP-dependent protease subunit HslV [Clostridia bacterium]